MTAEPKMEELLASIRKAIHEDIGEVPRALAARRSAAPITGSMRELRVKVGEEVSAAAAEIQELRQRISRNRAPELPAPRARFSREAETVVPVPQPSRYEEPAVAVTAPSHAGDPALLSAEAAAAAGSAFNRLTETFLSRAMGERPLENTARDMLRGMLKQWLDDNLPALVERLVREEIERVARRSR
ncbi:MAG: DUF2497 domain-containing protein [Rhizobiales bacterium]|nr:DUF2497 domain-containing protein [Hyphomicrobiales bacterium]MBI3672308.1 DUF2497 domain-containing protein [Hyphomicrobiales bacterium]